jgi:predicted nucleic acid-binding protein
MKFVLDTNVLVVAISRKSPHYWIWQTLQEGLYEIAVTTEILAEYAEILTNYLGQEVAYNVVETLANLPNVEHITRYYAW